LFGLAENHLQHRAVEAVGRAGFALATWLRASRRFIATADHVAQGLRKAFPKLRIEAVTGDLPSDDRRTKVSAMAAAEQRLLVATDCLSEGINLQSLFDTVVHYDLSWNPTRHQQREGRVDRFGQPAKLVRSVLLYSVSTSWR
jgi:superfamily II DNA/RNA helicase